MLFFEGRHDPFCRPEPVEEYEQAIEGPRTEMVWFEKAGHFPFFEKPEEFTEMVAKKVRPLVP